MPSAQGERDATIIAFPAERVSKAQVNHPHDALVIPLGTSTPHSEEAPLDHVIVNQTPENETATDDSSEAPSARVRQRAHNVAIHALATRGVSRSEIEARLVSRELPESVVEDEISALERQGLIDDAELAGNLVDKWVVRQGLGRRAAAEKMRQRGLSQVVIAEALEGISADDESERLREVAADRARALGSLPPDVAKRRLVAYLQRRGYSGNQVFQVATEVLG
jgi:SOS response regulatory protein OraA/RecX